MLAKGPLYDTKFTTKCLNMEMTPQYFAVSSVYTEELVPGKGALFQTFQPDTQILSALTAFTDLVQPSTDPVPPSTNQIV